MIVEYDMHVKDAALRHALAMHPSGAIPLGGVEAIIEDAKKIEAYLRGDGAQSVPPADKEYQPGRGLHVVPTNN